jgi:two-component system, cell cycle response regulator DivK
MPTIGVVEDNPDNRLLVRAILEELYEVVEYETGREALEAFRAAPPDLILLDISLPGMDGTEVLRHVRDDPGLAAIPVIALTAHAMTGDREKYLAEGFDDYLSKPIVEEEVLTGAIDRLLSRRRLSGGGDTPGSAKGF